MNHRHCIVFCFLFGCSAAGEGTAPNEVAGGTGGTLSNGTGGSSGGGSGGTVSLGTGGTSGSGGSSGSSSGGEECNGYDDDGDGQVDEDCPCVPGATQACFPFDPALASVGSCAWGTQTCDSSGEFGDWEPCTDAVGPEPETCGDGIDSDCDGADPACGTGGTGGSAGTGGTGGAGGTGGTGGEQPVCQSISLFGDCLTVSCPANAPYPESCQVFFTPGDDRGCVASVPTSPVVYFQAGDQCNAGFVTGTLCCTTTPQPPLTQQTCPINKPVQYHVASKNECPTTTD